MDMNGNLPLPEDTYPSKVVSKYDAQQYPTVKVRHKHEIDQRACLGVFFYILLPSLPQNWWLSAHTVGPPGSFAQVLQGDVSRWSSHPKMGGFGIQTMAEMAEICGFFSTCKACNLDHHVTF